MTDKSPSRRTRPSADPTRERVLDAALELFADRGFDGASTRDIAAKAGVAQPLLNYHFRSKDDLWREAVDRLFDQFRTTFERRQRGLRGVDLATTAELLVREFIVFSATHPQLHRIITQECKVDGPRMDWLIEQHIRPLYEFTTTMAAELSAAGVLPDIAPVHLYYILTGAAATMFVLAPECRRLSGLDPSESEVIETHADAVCALLFGERPPR
jgi:TetR/AcrR family transcriptional regulator